MAKRSHLMEQLAAPENLLTAWREVRGNIPRYRRARSAGPDGVSLDEFERDLGVQLSALRHALLKGTYQPQSPGHFSLPKRDGGERQISVMTVRDRVAQRAALHVLEPIWEPKFLPCSYGFRPGRSIDDAVTQARGLRQHGNRWVVDGDISRCFDCLDHTLLVERLQKRVSDDRVIDLLKKWLEVGVIQAGPPEGSAGWFENGVKKVASEAKHGVDWLLTAIAGQDEVSSYHPYELPIETPGRWPEMDPDSEDVEDSFYERQQAEMLRQKALRQVTTGGLLLGFSWLKPLLARTGSAAIGALKTPAGRRLLQKGLLATGGAGVMAAGAAAAAYYISSRSTSASIGVLQGSPLSPLLANIYLHSFDLTMLRANHGLIRFADDWVVLCPNQDAAEAAYNDAIRALAAIHLKANTEKTRILSPTDPLDWLGVVIR